MASSSLSCGIGRLADTANIPSAGLSPSSGDFSWPAIAFPLARLLGGLPCRLERLHNSAAHREDFRRQERVAGPLADTVHLPQQLEQLPSNRRIRLEWKLVELPGYPLPIPMRGHIEVIRFEVLVRPSGNLVPG